MLERGDASRPRRHVVGEAATAVVFQRGMVTGFRIDGGEPHALATTRTQHTRNARMRFVIRDAYVMCRSACRFGSREIGTHAGPRFRRLLTQRPAQGSSPKNLLAFFFRSRSGQFFLQLSNMARIDFLRRLLRLLFGQRRGWKFRRAFHAAELAKRIVVLRRTLDTLRLRFHHKANHAKPPVAQNRMKATRAIVRPDRD